jgi:4-alpha-glucanotransferase
LAVIALDDILSVRDQVNMPATIAQHPNWRRSFKP